MRTLRIYADRLARRGYDLVLVARNQERREALGDRLARETLRSTEVISGHPRPGGAAGCYGDRFLERRGDTH